jgi:hypothetical protein
LIVKSSGDDHLNFDAPIPANELVVALFYHITNEAVDMSWNEGGIMGVRGEVSRNNSFGVD